MRCTYDPKTQGGDAPDGRKVKATLHWVAADQAIETEVRLYDRLFLKEDPEEEEEGGDFTSHINPDSVQILKRCYVEPFIKNAKTGDRFQFERLGYFCVDSYSTNLKLVFNRTVPLKDTWAKIEKARKEELGKSYL